MPHRHGNEAALTKEEAFDLLLREVETLRAALAATTEPLKANRKARMEQCVFHARHIVIEANKLIKAVRQEMEG